MIEQPLTTHTSVENRNSPSISGIRGGTINKAHRTEIELIVRMPHGPEEKAAAQ